jgi:hypothetical protein
VVDQRAAQAAAAPAGSPIISRPSTTDCYTQVGVLMAWPVDRLGRPLAHFLLCRASNGCCDPEVLAESFLSHLQARNKDSKPRPKTNQSCAELAGQLTGKEAKRTIAQGRLLD